MDIFLISFIMAGAVAMYYALLRRWQAKDLRGVYVPKREVRKCLKNS